MSKQPQACGQLAGTWGSCGGRGTYQGPWGEEGDPEPRPKHWGWESGASPT